MAPEYANSTVGAPTSPDTTTPTLFQPLKIRGLHLHNRFVVSPMGTWNCQDGHLSDFHLVHLGSFALRGASLVIVESTAVTALGRTGPVDSGLWKDSQIAPLRRVVDFIHSQGQKAGVQLNHGGRKSSLVQPWMTKKGERKLAGKEDGGWPDELWAPSAVPLSEGFPPPKEMSVGQIGDIVKSFGEATRRAVEAGVDYIELHGAHAYLIHQFLTPMINKRTDKYGGSFENRTRFLFEVLRSVRAEMPDDMPLSLRISATDWMEHDNKQSSWRVEDSITLAEMLPQHGVDVLDVSSGGGYEGQRIPTQDEYYQIRLAGTIGEALRDKGVGLCIAAVGNINTPSRAQQVVRARSEEKGGWNDGVVEGPDFVGADLAYVGKQFLREPGFVLRCAEELGVTVGKAKQLNA